MGAPRATSAVIGGSGLYYLQDASAAVHHIDTPFSDTPVSLYLEQVSSGPLWFLPRHGRDHSIAPHEINYRANLYALQQVGVTKVLAVNVVGGISAVISAGALVIPDQIIDYSWGREHTFFAGQHSFDKHIDFTQPYDATLATTLAEAAAQLGIPIHKGAVYGCTQGPRLETAAEIRRLAKDGCDIVGMTGMPEAALARELQLIYACVALVVNRAAGLETDTISMADIRQVLEAGIGQLRTLVLATMASINN